MYYLETGLNKHDRFRSAVVFALAAHLALILGISFSADSPSQKSQQIEVTLISKASDSAPEDATLKAVANQEGSGDESDVTELTSREMLSAAAQAPRPEDVTQEDDSSQQQSEAVTTTAMASELINLKDTEKSNEAIEEPGLNEEVDSLNAEMAALQAELDEQTRMLADKPRVRRLTSASARQSADAAYLLDWRRKVEAVGNKYYPEASARYGIFGDVRLMVVIRSDGSLEDIKVLSSSGFAVLDEAAIKVVRMAAPYSAFPDELKKTTDKLEIVRTWHYEENSLSSQ